MNKKEFLNYKASSNKWPGCDEFIANCLPGKLGPI